MEVTWRNIPVFDPHKKVEVVVFKAKRDSVAEEKKVEKPVEEKKVEKVEKPKEKKEKPKLVIKVEEKVEKPVEEKKVEKVEEKKVEKAEPKKEKIDLSAVTGKKPDEPEKSKRIKFEKGSAEAIEWGKAMAEKRKAALDKRREALAIAAQTTG